MKFIEAKALLLQHAATTSEAEVRQEPASLAVTHTLRRDGEVSLLLLLTLGYASKRNHVYIGSGFQLYSPRLMTHPVDTAFLAANSDMPEAMLAKLIAVRTKMNGRVPYYYSKDLNPSEPLFQHTGPNDDWSEEQFLSYLIATFTVAHALAEMPLPAHTPETLLSWALSRANPAWMPAPILPLGADQWSIANLKQGPLGASAA